MCVCVCVLLCGVNAHSYSIKAHWWLWFTAFRSRDFTEWPCRTHHVWNPAWVKSKSKSNSHTEKKMCEAKKMRILREMLWKWKIIILTRQRVSESVSLRKTGGKLCLLGKWNCSFGKIWGRIFREENFKDLKKKQKGGIVWKKIK